MSRPNAPYEYEPPQEDEGRSSAMRWLMVAAAAAGAWLWRRRRHRSPDESPPEEEIAAGHRPVDDTPEGAIVLFGIGLAVLIALVLGGVALIINVMEDDDRASVESEPMEWTSEDLADIPARPRLQSDPAIELKEVREREERRLLEYRWMDREAGVVAIPIDRAMALFADSASAAAGGMPAPDTLALAPDGPDTLAASDGPDTLAASDEPDTLAASANREGSTGWWTGDAQRPDAIRILTESGYIYRTRSMSASPSPPFLGRSPEPYTVNPDLARILDYVNVRNDTLPRRD